MMRILRPGVRNPGIIGSESVCLIYLGRDNGNCLAKAVTKAVIKD